RSLALSSSKSIPSSRSCFHSEAMLLMTPTKNGIVSTLLGHDLLSSRTRQRASFTRSSGSYLILPSYFCAIRIKRVLSATVNLLIKFSISASDSSSLISNARQKDQFGHRTYYFFLRFGGVRSRSGSPQFCLSTGGFSRLQGDATPGPLNGGNSRPREQRQ